MRICALFILAVILQEKSKIEKPLNIEVVSSKERGEFKVTFKGTAKYEEDTTIKFITRRMVNKLNFQTMKMELVPSDDQPDTRRTSIVSGVFKRITNMKTPGPYIADCRIEREEQLSLKVAQLFDQGTLKPYSEFITFYCGTIYDRLERLQKDIKFWYGNEDKKDGNFEKAFEHIGTIKTSNTYEKTEQVIKLRGLFKDEKKVALASAAVDYVEFHLDQLYSLLFFLNSAKVNPDIIMKETKNPFEGLMEMAKMKDKEFTPGGICKGDHKDEDEKGKCERCTKETNKKGMKICAKCADQLKVCSYCLKFTDKKDSREWKKDGFCESKGEHKSNIDPEKEKKDLEKKKSELEAKKKELEDKKNKSDEDKKQLKEITTSLEKITKDLKELDEGKGKCGRCDEETTKKDAKICKKCSEELNACSTCLKKTKKEDADWAEKGNCDKQGKHDAKAETGKCEKCEADTNKDGMRLCEKCAKELKICAFCLKKVKTFEDEFSNIFNKFMPNDTHKKLLNKTFIRELLICTFEEMQFIFKEVQEAYEKGDISTKKDKIEALIKKVEETQSMLTKKEEYKAINKSSKVGTALDELRTDIPKLITDMIKKLDLEKEKKELEAKKEKLEKKIKELEDKKNKSDDEKKELDKKRKELKDVTTPLEKVTKDLKEIEEKVKKSIEDTKTKLEKNIKKLRDWEE